jgi:uncharacterized protein (DUF1697 family)
LGQALGYQVPTTVRSATELGRIASSDPFPPEAVAAGGGKPQVILLFDAPTEPVRREVLGLATDADRLAFGPRELHWLPSGGILDSELDLERIFTLVGLNTMRTANTIRRLAAKL